MIRLTKEEKKEVDKIWENLVIFEFELYVEKLFKMFYFIQN